MANSILKLKVESEEYDAKLKRAAEGIRHLAEYTHRGAGELTGLDKAEVAYIRSLGDMDTKSRTAAGSVRELENTFKELTVVYNNLNDVEKADEGGKALAASLETLKQRAQEARGQLDEATRSLQSNSGAGNESGGVLDMLASRFTLNIDAIKLFNIGLQAAKVALGVAQDAFFASEATVDEWGRTVAASQSLYESFITAINNGDISGFLNNMNEIVTAAVNAYNALDRLNTMQTIQSPQITRQETENQRLMMMIRTGRYISPQDGRKPATGMKDGDILSPNQIKYFERQLQNGTKAIVNLNKNEINQRQIAIDAYYNKLAKQNGMSVNEFKKGTSSWAEFEKRMQGYSDYEKWRSENYYTDNWGNRRVKEGNPHQQYKNWGVFRVDKMGENSYNDLVGLIKQQGQQQSQVYSAMGQVYRTINRTEGITVRDIMGGSGGGSSHTGSPNRSGHTQLTPAQQAEKDVERANKDYADTISNAQQKLMEHMIKSDDYDKQVLSGQERLAEAYLKAYNTTGDEKYLNSFRELAAQSVDLKDTINANAEAQKAAEQAAREQAAAEKKLAEEIKKRAELEASFRENTEGGVGAFISNQKGVLQKAEYGSQDYRQLSENIADANTYKNLMETAIQDGLYDIVETMKPLWEQIVSEKNIGDTTWQSYVDEINAVRKSSGKEAISLDYASGDVKAEEPDDKLMDKVQKVTSGLQQVSGGLQQMGIKLPDGVTKILGGVQGLMSVIQGVQAVISVFSTSTATAQVTAITANTGALVAVNTQLPILISALYANAVTPFAGGGIVGRAASGLLVGTSYSGDNRRLPVVGGGMIGVNDGELILNRAQQGVVADALTGGSGDGGRAASPYVTGQAIVLGAKNYLRASGQGELVTTKMLRNMRFANR